MFAHNPEAAARAFGSGSVASINNEEEWERFFNFFTNNVFTQHLKTYCNDRGILASAKKMDWNIVELYRDNNEQRGRKKFREILKNSIKKS